MVTSFLPEYRVVSEARIYREAALLLEESARAGRTDLYWPAATNAALSIEIYLKSFLVKKVDAWVELNDLAKQAGHNLTKLWQAIEPEHQGKIEHLNHQFEPAIDLESLFTTYASFFPRARYSYEADRERVVRGELFSLMDRLEDICSALLPQVVNQGAKEIRG